MWGAGISRASKEEAAYRAREQRGKPSQATVRVLAYRY